MSQTDRRVVPSPEEIFKRELHVEDVERLILNTGAPCKTSAEKLAQALRALKREYSVRLAGDIEPTSKQTDRFIAQLEAALRKTRLLLDALENKPYYLEVLIHLAAPDFPSARAARNGVRDAVNRTQSLHDWTKRPRKWPQTTQDGQPAKGQPPKSDLKTITLRREWPVERSVRDRATTWLLGIGIGGVFERHFDWPTGYGLAADKSRRNPNSPGARFARGVLEMFGLPKYSIRRLQKARETALEVEVWTTEGEPEP